MWPVLGAEGVGAKFRYTTCDVLCVVPRFRLEVRPGVQVREKLGCAADLRITSKTQIERKPTTVVTGAV
jgi:hypothetical protein